MLFMVFTHILLPRPYAQEKNWQNRSHQLIILMWQWNFLNKTLHHSILLFRKYFVLLICSYIYNKCLFQLKRTDQFCINTARWWTKDNWDSCVQSPIHLLSRSFIFLVTNVRGACWKFLAFLILCARNQSNQERSLCTVNTT